MSQNPPAPQGIGSISSDGQFRWDGQQWVALPPGYREPTPWTRPMQLAAGAIFLCEAVVSLAVSFIFVNHDNMLRALQAQGTSIPAGTSIDTVLNYAIAVAIGVVVFFAVLEVIGAIGSFLGWRWMFWLALVLFGFGGLGALTNLITIFRPDTSPIPIVGLLFSELLSIASLAMFVWMVIGLIRYGPWATKKMAI